MSMGSAKSGKTLSNSPLTEDVEEAALRIMGEKFHKFSCTHINRLHGFYTTNFESSAALF
ncbi:hypothetical protein YC2023_067050 [Brassica napus]